MESQSDIKYWKTIGTRNEVYIGVPLCEAEEISEELYLMLSNPTENLRWQWLREDITDLVPNRKRAVLYERLRYYLTGDTLAGDLDESRPFYQSLTVDEMSRKYLQYVGDDDEKATACLDGKREAKAYIRSLFPEEEP